MTAVDVVLTPAQEEAGWAVMDAIEAAKASGDVHAEIEALGAFFDWQLAVGLMTRDDMRAMQAPHLSDLIAIADERPEGRKLLAGLREDAMELLGGEDYNERAGAALFILSVDAVQNSRRYEARRAKDAAGLAEWAKSLRSIETGTHLAAILLRRWDYPEAPSDMSARLDAQEARRASVRALRHARELLTKMGETVDDGGAE